MSRKASAIVTAPSRRPSATLVAGLAIGLAIGAAVALMLAPGSGAETRRAMKNRGTRVRNRTADAWEDIRLELQMARRALRRKRRDAQVAPAPEAPPEEG